MTVDDLERAVKARGYKHQGPLRNPQQLRASIAAMPHRNPLVRRVGWGIYGLTALGERDGTKRSR